MSGTHTTALILGLTASHYSQGYSVVGVSFGVEFKRPVFADACVHIEWEEVVATTMVRENVQQVEMREGMYDQSGALCVGATGGCASA